MQYTQQLAGRALVAATALFTANFAVWTLYAVIGLDIAARLSLSATEFGVLLAAPMLSGTLLRYPAGLLSERFSARTLLVWQSLMLIPALLLLRHVQGYVPLLLMGLWLGIAGVSFVFGVRYLSPWFESRQQGTALGVFGAGNVGAAITLACAPAVSNWLGAPMVGRVFALGLLLVTGLFALWAPEETPYMRSRRRSELAFHLQPLRDLRVWRFGLYYYFVFGSFLALLLWLPRYYVSAYGTSTETALLLTLLFVILSSSVRAAGGWFADRYGARAVNWSVFWTCLVCLFFLSYPPTSMTIHGVERDVHLNVEVGIGLFTLLILVIGIAQGFGRASVYRIVFDKYPQQMGSASGLVATIGAFGGFSLPVAFGLAQDIVGIHSAAFMVLYGVLASCMLAMYLVLKRERARERLHFAREHNFLHEVP
ncbi:MFS transporter [Microbulbifer hainanensis]|uniref:MFS transporter n=1 Tax=Microbulbifer hainanensis TaxID=2735675 RepID=UPI0018668234|nr:MFS transporter [Microbulbifer hainanensis]